MVALCLAALVNLLLLYLGLSLEEHPGKSSMADTATAPLSSNENLWVIQKPCNFG
jgi:hypothetical protein